MRTLVVIPVFNRPVLVSQALDSVAAQTIQPDAVVVVDDGSTDNTSASVSAWIQEHPNLTVRLIRSAHRGASAARNLGLARMGAAMEAVAFLDSDDRWPADFLARTGTALQSRHDVVAASTDREFRWLHEDRRHHDSLATITDNPWLWMIARDGGIGSCTLFRVAAIHAAGGYPEDIPTGHDAVLFGRIAAEGAWLHVPGEPTVFMRSSIHGGHLHHRHPDYLVWWAKTAHQVWQGAPAGVEIGAHGRMTLLHRWRAAAHDALRRNESAQAHYCLAHAIRLRPMTTKYWWLWLRTHPYRGRR